MANKLLVCGASGFIGRNMAEYFAARDGLEVYGTYFNSPPSDNPRINVIRADLRKKEDVEKIVGGMDVIIQTAATTSGAKDIRERPYIHVTDNVVMNSLLFREAHDKKVPRVVFFSCSVMYQSSDKPVKETDFNANVPLVPTYFGVGWTKIYLEKMAQFYAELGNTKFTVARHSNIYGPYDKFDLEKSHVFGATMTKVLQAKDDRVVVWGEGREERDLLHVSDLTNFVDLALEKQKDRFGLYNVGAGRSVSVRDLVGRIISYSGKDLKIEYDTSKPTIPTKLALDSTKAREQLGWAPQVPLDDGIRRTLAWYREKILPKANP